MTNEQTLIRNTPLYALKNKSNGEVFEITSSTTVGRQKDCDIILDDNHVSRLHATLKVSGAALIVNNESSGNGTFVNGEKIQEAVLQENDIVKFDSHEFMVMLLSKETNSSDTLIEGDSITNIHQEEHSKATMLMPEVWADAKKKSSSAATGKAQADAVQASSVSSQSSSSNSETGFLYKTEMNKILSKDRISTEKNDPPRKDIAQAIKEGGIHMEEGVTHLFGYHPLVFDEVFPLNKQTILIGKSQSSDIILKDASVSSKHAEIFLANNKWVLKDLNSTNGTFLNGQEISEPVKLKQGDFIQFGLIQLVFGQLEPLSYSPSKFSYGKWATIAASALLLLAGAVFFIKR